MAARRMMLPDYGTVSMKGTQYYRTRVTDQQGRRVSLYARTREELYQKEQEAIQQIENKTYRRSTPTVEEYCEKWLLMQSAQIRMTTLIDYTSKVKNYIIKPFSSYLSSYIACCHFYYHGVQHFLQGCRMYVKRQGFLTIPALISF